MTNFMQSFVHDPHTTISNVEAYLQGFLVVLKHSLQNYKKILKKYFLGTLYVIICLVYERVNERVNDNVFFLWERKC